MSDHPEIVSRSLPEANMDIVELGPRAAVVSIGEPDTPTPYGFKEGHPLHVRLEFHDVINPDLELVDYDIQPPTRKHVQELLEHARVLRTAELVYCHCAAGVSRSTACAFVLRCLWSGPGSEMEAIRAVLEDRPSASPNELIVRYADEELERQGAMIAALSECPELL